MTVETVARLERVLRGRSSANANPSLDTLSRLSSALGVDITDLLSDVAGARPKDDRLAAVVRGASPAARQRILRVAEVLMREDRALPTQRPVKGRRGKN